MAPIVAAIVLGGPAVGGWVAALGTTEMRELRGRIPWYGSLANHAGLTLPAIVAGVVYWQSLESRWIQRWTSRIVDLRSARWWPQRCSLA